MLFSTESFQYETEALKFPQKMSLTDNIFEPDSN